MIAARSFAAELEREKTAQRTHEHLLTKARRGLVVGGRVIGYDDVEVKEGDRRVRVEYKVNEAQAAIVREIFRRYAEGEGLRALVKDLNERQVPPPRAGRRGTGSWSPSSIHEMIRRERYRGVLVWGKQEKTYKGGTKVRVPRALRAATGAPAARRGSPLREAHSRGSTPPPPHRHPRSAGAARSHTPPPRGPDASRSFVFLDSRARVGIARQR